MLECKTCGSRDIRSMNRMVFCNCCNMTAVGQPASAIAEFIEELQPSPAELNTMDCQGGQ